MTATPVAPDDPGAPRRHMPSTGRTAELAELRDTSNERLRCDLLLALGDAERRAGDARYRETVAKAAAVARALGDGERLALAALTSTRPGGFPAILVDEELITLHEEARVALGHTDSVLRARVLGLLGVELAYTLQRERRDALSREAIAIARRLGDRSGLAQVIALRLIAMNDPFTLAERLELTAELAALAGELGSSELACLAAVHRISALLESGDIRGTEGTLVEVERLVGELRQPSYMWIARLGRTMLAVMRGAPDAEAQVLATFELGTASNQPDARDGLAAQLSGVRHNQGRLAELADTMRIIVEAQPHIPAWRALLALLYSETDQVAEAREQIDILRLNGFDYPPNWAWSMYMLSLSETVCDLHDTPAAAVLYERLRPVASQVGTSCAVSVCQGSYALYCGMLAACLGCWDDAERHFGEALSMSERLGARPYLVRTRRAWGSMLLDRGAPGDAARTNELLAAGLAEARELGMAREIVRIERLLEHMDVARPG